jgi:hypothetical protein
VFAQVGDEIVVGGRRMRQRDRVCRVLEIVDASGDPRYVVRWDDTGEVGMFSSGPDAAIVSREHRRR